MTPWLTHHDDVTVLHLGDGENRFTPEWMTAVDTALDELASAAPAALVTTGDGR